MRVLAGNPCRLVRSGALVFFLMAGFFFHEKEFHSHTLFFFSTSIAFLLSPHSVVLQGSFARLLLGTSRYPVIRSRNLPPHSILAENGEGFTDKSCGRAVPSGGVPVRGEGGKPPCARASYDAGAARRECLPRVLFWGRKECFWGIGFPNR